MYHVSEKEEMSRYISLLYLESIGMSQNHLTFFQLDNKQNPCLEIIHVTCFDFHLSFECRQPYMHACTKKMQMVDTSNTTVHISQTCCRRHYSWQWPMKGEVARKLIRFGVLLSRGLATNIGKL